jgi:uncharacterized protein YndB with AHSA1/START domain
MEQKTKIDAQTGKQEILITRDFDLPLELLFKAFEDPEIIEQWMGTKVLELENKKHGSWLFETKDPQGNVVFTAHGVYHEFIPDQKITRTFEMGNSPLDVQLQFLEFEKLTGEASRHKMHIIYRSVAHRDQQLQMPFAYGINMAHNQLQQIVSKLK